MPAALWRPASRRARHRPPEIAGRAAPGETPHCLLRFACTLRGSAPPSSRENPGPIAFVKTPRSAAAIPAPLFRCRKGKGCRDPSKGTASAARTRRAREGPAPAAHYRGRAAILRTLAGRSGPRVHKAHAAFLAHSYPLQIVAVCVAVPPRLAGRARTGESEHLAFFLRVGCPD